MSEEIKIDTTIADMLHGADMLSVVADKCEEMGAVEIMKIAANAAGDAYYRIGVELQRKNRYENAREAYVKSHAHFIRGDAGAYKIRLASRGADITYPLDGNGYW